MFRISPRWFAPLVALLVASLGLFATTADRAGAPAEPQRVTSESDAVPGAALLAPSRTGHDAAVVRPASTRARASVTKGVPVVVVLGGLLAWLAVGALGLAPWLGPSAPAPPRTYVRRRGPPALVLA
jgi:hypothetical protein